MRKLYTILIIAVILIAAGVALWWHMSPEPSRVTLLPATVSDIRQMVRLCTTEIYEDVPIKGTVGTRHLVARQLLRGTITFDVDRLEVNQHADTLVVTLPPEQVDVYESTDPDAYVVLDTWNDRPLASSNISSAEENRMKQLAREYAIKRIYSKGYVRQARDEAQHTLASFVRAITGRPVIVVDPTPDGKMK